MKDAVVLWTGGKDSCLALHLARENNLNILGLVTFVPPGPAEFQAHPQSEIRNQARRLGLPIHFIEINEPYKQSYVEALKWIHARLSATVVITGDIDLVNGFPNWIEECCKEAEIEVSRPLWKKPREWVMEELLARGIQAKITLINHSSLPKEWKGRIIDEQLLIEMKAVSASTGIDLAGESGEYHTMVVASPAFAVEP